jgi:uncharacterized protein (TIGR02596 family)
MRAFRKPRDGAFSLLELLLVIGLGVLLAALALGAYSSMMQAAALATGGERLQEALVEAQQAAISQNLTVEVRFYALPDAAGATPVYRTLQGHELKPDGTISPTTPPVTLPASVVLDPTAAHSPLLATNPETATADPGDPLLNNQTRVFHFLPDGSTDLNPGGTWFATLRAEAASDPAHFPANWICLALDPTTGRVQVYRP